MTIERAIELLQTGSKFPEVFHTTEEVDEACQMAIAALNAQKNLEPYTEADQKGRLHILPPENSVAQCLDLAKQVTDMGLNMQQALDMLRAQQEQPNEPLTLEELLDIQEPTPLWIVSVGGDFKPYWSIECWINSLTLFEILDDNSTNTMSKRDAKSTYGKIWLAYRRRPGEDVEAAIGG